MAPKVAGKVAKEGLKATDSAVKAFLKRAQEAVRSGADKAVVAPIIAGVKAGTRTVKAADKKLIDVVTRQKRTKGGAGYTTKTPTGAAKFEKKGAGKVKRGVARAGVYGGAAAGVAIAGDAVKKEKTKREKAAEARITAQEKSDQQIDGLTAALKKKAAAKKKADAEKKAAGVVGGTSKGKGKGKDDRVLPGIRPFGGVLAKVLLGKDEKFGGDKGLIDFLRPSKWGKGKKPAAKKPVKKNMGGMVNKASANKSSTRGKPRGVGAATRGYGKAMR